MTSLYITLLCSLGVWTSSALVVSNDDHGPSFIINVDDHSVHIREVQWAETAMNLLDHLSCSQALFTTTQRCEDLVQIPRDRMALWVAPPSPHGRYRALLPDGSLSRAGSTDVVVAIDPYPEANFGHLVLVFYVDFYSSLESCRKNGGILTDTNECVRLVEKNRCKNKLARRGRRRNLLRRCEINFIPVVHLETDVGHGQQLTCLSQLAGFGPCPASSNLRTADPECDPLRENSRRCETTHHKVHTSCRRFEMCDQAVVVAGGWNPTLSHPRHEQNVRRMFQLFRTNKFNKRAIELFFANGLPGGIDDDEDDFVQEVHPTSPKSTLRYHLQTLCQSPLCTDTLLIYLNNPTTADGTMLLWDADHDGLAGESERYSQAEFLSDISRCQARQVHVIADQSYSGELARDVTRSTRHRNVVIHASSAQHQYAYAAEFTRHWTQANHTHQCAQNIQRQIEQSMTHSTPEMAEGRDVTQRTIFGAPCDVITPYTRKELRLHYWGCQTVPTALWVQKMSQEIRRSTDFPTVPPLVTGPST